MVVFALFSVVVIFLFLYGKSDSGINVAHGQTELIWLNKNTCGNSGGGGGGVSSKVVATLMKDGSVVVVPINYPSGRVIFEINIDNFMRVAHKMDRKICVVRLKCTI